MAPIQTKKGKKPLDVRLGLRGFRIMATSHNPEGCVNPVTRGPGSGSMCWSGPESSPVPVGSKPNIHIIRYQVASSSTMCFLDLLIISQNFNFYFMGRAAFFVELSTFGYSWLSPRQKAANFCPNYTSPILQPMNLCGAWMAQRIILGLVQCVQSGLLADRRETSLEGYQLFPAKELSTHNTKLKQVCLLQYPNYKYE